MAYSFDVNNTIATNPVDIVFAMKELMKTVGWTVQSSSDGTTYNSSGDQLAAASDLNNSRAWFRIRQPSGGTGFHAGTRELVFQRTSAGNGYQWRIKYSVADGFTGGTPGATQTPSATDEITLNGSGSDASPTFGSSLANDSGSRYHVIAGDAAENFSFGVFQIAAGGGANIQAGWIFDGLDDTDALDEDPFLLRFNATNLAAASVSVGQSTVFINTSGLPGGHYKLNLTGEAFDNWQYTTYGTNSSTRAIPQTVGPSPWSGDIQLASIPVTRNSGTRNGLKGISHLFRWVGGTITSGDTFSVGAGTRNWFSVPDMAVPWDGSVPTV